MHQLHACIISWSHQEKKAEAIANTSAPLVDKLTVIYSTEDESSFEGHGNWVKVPNHFYFGKKFEKMLKLHRGDILLNIQADCESEDWGHLIKRCREAFQKQSQLWLWAPLIDFTPWTNKHVELSYNPITKESLVTQTDSLVWAFAKPLIQKMKLLNYKKNNFGWGIDWIASTYAFHNKHLVVRDQSILVRHPKGTGYDVTKAYMQQKKFLSQLTEKEHMTYHALQFYSRFIKKVPFGDNTD